ncbi:hypothetical protein JL720_12666 [Aureococcus anophagefferens]|nr:hypothetical protein JL720_12666 [Aureococcus anophagefferens]
MEVAKKRGNKAASKVIAPRAFDRAAEMSVTILHAGRRQKISLSSNHVPVHKIVAEAVAKFGLSDGASYGLRTTRGRRADVDECAAWSHTGLSNNCELELVKKTGGGGAGGPVRVAVAVSHRWSAPRSAAFAADSSSTLAAVVARSADEGAAPPDALRRSPVVRALRDKFEGAALERTLASLGYGAGPPGARPAAAPMDTDAPADASLDAAADALGDALAAVGAALALEGAAVAPERMLTLQSAAAQDAAAAKARADAHFGSADDGAGRGDSNLVAKAAAARERSRREKEDAPMTTKAMRDVAALEKLRVYDVAAIKVQFPDRTVLGARFHPREPVAAVYAAVRGVLAPGAPDFALFVSPPKRDLPPGGGTLADLGLVPAAKVFVSWASPATGPYLSDASLALLDADVAASAFPEAKPVAERTPAAAEPAAAAKPKTKKPSWMKLG